VALHVKYKFFTFDAGGGELLVERSFFIQIEPAAALARLNARNVLAAPQAEIKKSRRGMAKRLALRSASSCASRFAARLMSDKGTGRNSPLEVVSRLIGFVSLQDRCDVSWISSCVTLK
jgi:hypothetical protein